MYNNISTGNVDTTKMNQRGDRDKARFSRSRLVENM